MTEQIAGRVLLNIKTLAADAENAALTARLNTDMLVQAYIELQTENLQLRHDAERYRWLRDRIGGAVPVVRVQIMRQGQYVLIERSLDAAIDAAMKT